MAGSAAEQHALVRLVVPARPPALVQARGSPPFQVPPVSQDRPGDLPSEVSAGQGQRGRGLRVAAKEGWLGVRAVSLVSRVGPEHLGAERRVVLACTVAAAAL